MIPIIFIGIVYLWISYKAPPPVPVLPKIEKQESVPVVLADTTTADSLDAQVIAVEDTGKTGAREPAPMLAKVMIDSPHIVLEKEEKPEPSPPSLPVKEEKEPKPVPVETNSPPTQVEVVIPETPPATMAAVEQDTANTFTPNRDSLVALIEDPALLFKMKEYNLAARRWYDQKKLSYSRFTIVLMYACSPATIDTVLSVIPEPEELFILPKMIEEQGCYIICWGDFETRQMADAQYLSLPPWFAEHGLSPMVRPFFKIDQLTRLTMTRLIMNQRTH